MRLFVLLMIASATAFGNPTPPKMLIVGDSQMYGKFGEVLHQRAASLNTFHVRSYAVCGASSRTFMKRFRTNCGYIERESLIGEEPRLAKKLKHAWSEDLLTMIQDFKPKFLVIALGTNSLQFSADKIKLNTKELVNAIQGETGIKKIIWVGPPNFPGSDIISGAIKEAVGVSSKLVYVDSIEFNKFEELPRKNPHFGHTRAGNWANFVFDKFASRLKTTTPTRALSF